MQFQPHKILSSALLASALVFGASAASADTSVLAYKLGVHSTGVNAINAATGWVNPGGFNEASAAAQLLSVTSMDYKNSFVDTNWSQVLSVQVAMYSMGVKVASIDFSPSTDKYAFFASANVTGSSYSDALGALFFNIDGSGNYNRHWFINNNYGGCGADAGHWVVLDQPFACGWETTRTSAEGRAFLYSTGSTLVNWNDISGGVGTADVYAIFITVADVPEPTTVVLFGLGLAGLGLARRRAHPSA